MPRHYKNYSINSIRKAVKISLSITQVLRRLNLQPVGGNFLTIKTKIQEYNINISHFTGQLWSKGKSLKNIKDYRKRKFQKEAVAKERGLRICERCKRSKWFGKPIPLQLHHKDRDRTNYDDNNLELLCLNCHGIEHNRT